MLFFAALIIQTIESTKFSKWYSKQAEAKKKKKKKRKSWNSHGGSLNERKEVDWLYVNDYLYNVRRVAFGGGLLSSKHFAKDRLLEDKLKVVDF